MFPTLSFVPQTRSNSKDHCQPCLLTPARRTTWLVLAPFLLHPAYLEIRFKFHFCGSKGEENWVPHHNRGPSPGYRLVLWSHYLPGQQSSKWWKLGQWVSARTHFAPIPGHLVISWDIFACHSGGKGVATGTLVSKGQGCCWIQCIGQIAQQIIKWSKRSVLRLKIPHPKGTHRLPGVSR